MPFIVYILYTEKYNKHYTGFTSDIENRLLSHNVLGKGWTAKYRPWKLIFSKEFNTKKDAMEYEKWLKTGVGRDFIKTKTYLYLHYLSSAHNPFVDLVFILRCFLDHQFWAISAETHKIYVTIVNDLSYL